MTTSTDENRPAKSKKAVDKETESKNRFSADSLKEFIGEVKIEFEKVAWPDKKHTVGSTVVVVILVMIISFYLGGVDLLLGKLISLALR